MILVTGAAGKTGLAVLSALHARDLAARALIHRPEYGKLALDAGASELAVADLRDDEAFAAALAGVDALYLILPNMFQGEYQLGRKLIELAQQAAVPRLVYHSVLYPEVRAMPHHWDKHLLEQYLHASEMDFSILQPASYMQNILSYWQAIKENGVYKVPYDVDAQFNPVDLEDVAEVAARVLAEPGQSAASYPLCGPEILSSAGMAAFMARHLGREVQAQQEPIENWRQRAKQQGLTPYALDSLTAMFTYYDEHGFDGPTETLPKLLGRPPTTFAQFLARLN